MTVGQELCKITDLTLFHNHMTIDLLHPLFGFSSEMWRLAKLFRNEVFESFSKSDSYGLIFTKVWDFSSEQEWEGIERMCKIFESKGIEVYFIELEADTNERLIRNKSPHRLEHKPTKKNLQESEEHLLLTLENLRLNSYEGEISKANYLRINNTHLSASAVAEKIKMKFKF
ncbi:shikimate kinase [Rossellomorea aquimaris]|uniref:shikimate kinase n=1 Tax=Rossellomorea aquimaris TaxID=189382 RepID=UPI002E26712B